MKSTRPSRLFGLPPLDRQVWILIIGRLLSQLGTGFTLFYAPVFFVNQVGLSATAVGIGLGCESITGVVGRVFGGSLADSPRWGRRKTVMLSLALSACASLLLAFSNNFLTFLLGTLLMGLGVGLYWPATETMVADLTTLEQRNEAYALNRLADSVGLSLGVVLGGAWIAATGAYRLLFVVDALSFLVFLGVIYGAIAETLNPDQVEQKLWQGWSVALGDRPLLVFVSVNILFTTYLALISSTLPLYFSKFGATPADHFSPAMLSVLFTGYIVVTALTQLPIARRLRYLPTPRALMISAVSWAVGFSYIWMTSVMPSARWMGALLGLGVMALATAVYNPSASLLVTGLAPVHLRGVYLSINSLCWAAGYFIGPALGGWAMDQSAAIANGFWLVIAATVGGILLVLRQLERVLPVQPTVQLTSSAYDSSSDSSP